VPNRLDFICLYTGPPDECMECTGYDPTGTGTCCHECAADRAARLAAADAAEAARRAREEAFGVAVAALRAAGYSYDDCDIMLAHIPT
jgi:hypothetical protein